MKLVKLLAVVATIAAVYQLVSPSLFKSAQQHALIEQGEHHREMIKSFNSNH